MAKDVLFSLADVHMIRQKVQTQAAPASAERRAELVAAAISQTIRSRLPEWTEPWRAKIADILVRRCLVEEKREIRQEDVLKVCSDLGVAAMDARQVASAGRGAGVSGEVLSGASSTSASLSDGAIASASTSGASAPGSIVARIPRMAWLMASFVLVGGLMIGVQLNSAAPQVPPMTETPQIEMIQAPPADVGMPAEFRFQPIQADAVKDYLNSRDSLLAEEPYFSAIVSQAEAFDLNPLLLFAIAGQEQGFVPKSHKQAAKIANNPFNVYHSWQQFNTDISHSAEIAARTIVRRTAERPEGYDPFVWLNMTYAEDPGWARGVRQIFEKLSSLSAPSIHS